MSTMLTELVQQLQDIHTHRLNGDRRHRGGGRHAPSRRTIRSGGRPPRRTLVVLYCRGPDFERMLAEFGEQWKGQDTTGGIRTGNARGTN